MATLTRHRYMLHFFNTRGNECRTAVVARGEESNAVVLDRALSEAKNLSGKVKVVRDDGQVMWERGRVIEDGGMVHGL